MDSSLLMEWIPLDVASYRHERGASGAQVEGTLVGATGTSSSGAKRAAAREGPAAVTAPEAA